jgi:subtilisin-like proprotein convertase family protein
LIRRLLWSLYAASRNVDAGRQVDPPPSSHERRLVVRRIALLSASMILAVVLASGAALAATTVVEKKFSNPQKISIWDPNTDFEHVREAEPYPSEITVSGFNDGSIRDVNLRLKGFKHTCPADVGVLLVGPQGQEAVVMDHVGSCFDIRGVNLTLDDEAAECLPTRRRITSGTYRPTQDSTQGRRCDGSFMYDGSFPPPAPTGPYPTALSVFDGTDPNGTWKLYVIDGFPEDIGHFRYGWSLTIRARVTV